MLANGATLGFRVHGGTGTTYTDLPGLKEIPEMGMDPELVENTCLTDSLKQYEMGSGEEITSRSYIIPGIGDAGDMQYVFKYVNDSADSPYRVMLGHQAAKTVLDFCETLFDGTKYEYTAQVSVKRGGGGVNGVIDWTLGVALQSEITITHPAAGAGG